MTMSTPGTVSTYHTDQSQKNLNRTKTSRAVLAGRVLFLSFLTAVAAVLGFLAHFFLSNSETELAETHFNAIADRALSSAKEITRRKTLGTVSLASVVANRNPNATDWPFVVVNGYEDMSTNLIETSSGREMGFCPLVTPDQLSAFETFAYDYYQNSRKPPFPNGTATSSFGEGIWGVDPELDTKDKRYHESDGTTSYDSPNKIFAPILHHNEGPHRALMINLHFQETRGRLIDDMIACSSVRGTSIDENMACGGITDMLILTSQEVEPGPGALIMQPIYPAYDPFEVCQDTES